MSITGVALLRHLPQRHPSRPLDRPHRPSRFLPTECHSDAHHRELHKVAVHYVLPALRRHSLHYITRRNRLGRLPQHIQDNPLYVAAPCLSRTREARSAWLRGRGQGLAPSTVARWWSKLLAA